MRVGHESRTLSSGVEEKHSLLATKGVPRGKGNANLHEQIRNLKTGDLTVVTLRQQLVQRSSHLHSYFVGASVDSISMPAAVNSRRPYLPRLP